MQEQAKLALSSKGKAREDVHWQLGWWDFAHALEGTRRSVMCTSSFNVVFTTYGYDKTPGLVQRIGDIYLASLGAAGPRAPLSILQTIRPSIRTQDSILPRKL